MSILDTHGHLISPEPNSGCWLWGGATSRDGYGKMTYKQQRYSSHRFAWTLSNGPIPKGLWVLHKCDVKLCVNPDHLFVGTHTDNMQDALRKGVLNRHSKGQTNPAAKLTWADVQAIRGDDRLQEVVAGDYGVSDTTISQIKNNKQWKV